MLVCELGLVLLADPVSGLVVAYCILQDHDIKHFLCFSLGEFALADEVTDAQGQCIYTLIWKLLNIGDQFFPEGQAVLLRLNSCPDSIYSLPGCLHALLCYGTIVYKGLESLLSSPSNMSFSCFQPLWQSSASSVSMSRASR